MNRYCALFIDSALDQSDMYSMSYDSKEENSHCGNGSVFIGE